MNWQPGDGIDQGQLEDRLFELVRENNKKAAEHLKLERELTELRGRMSELAMLCSIDNLNEWFQNRVNGRVEGSLDRMEKAAKGLREPTDD